MNYTYYVANKTTNTFQLSKTFTFGSSPAPGAAVTGGTNVSSVTNLYRQKLISDNWLGWDEVNQKSLIECGVQWPHKIGPCFQNIMPQTVDFKHHITTNYEIKGQGQLVILEVGYGHIVEQKVTVHGMLVLIKPCMDLLVMTSIG